MKQAEKPPFEDKAPATGLPPLLTLYRPNEVYCFPLSAVSWLRHELTGETLTLGCYDAHIAVTGRGLGRIRAAIHGANSVSIREQGEAGENMTDAPIYVCSIKVGPRRDIGQ